MKKIAITGGTDGIGRALAQRVLERGDQVVVVGTSQPKGEAFLTAAERLGAADRAAFIRADLELIDENMRVIEELSARLDRLDALVLGARYQRARRVETADGLESNFALVYLSRFLLSHGLVDLLSRSADPVVLTFGGAGAFGTPQWDDLQQQRYHGVAAMVHAGVLTGFLAVDFVDRHAATGIRFIDIFPGPVATSFAGDHDSAAIAQIARLRSEAKPVATAVDEMLPFLDSGAPGRVTAVNQGVAVTPGPEAASLSTARRLFNHTSDLPAVAAASTRRPCTGRTSGEALKDA